jgi:hypothetical protein
VEKVAGVYQDRHQKGWDSGNFWDASWGCRDNYTQEVSVNLFEDDLTCVTPDELRVAIVGLAQAGIEEKFRLDFKETWDQEKRVQDVAAFANTYGGLLIFGVSDDRQRFPGIAGPRNSDLKTQVSSTIASRISPPPLFEVHTCPASTGSSNFLVVVRIQLQHKLHLYLKGDRPVWVRTEDKSEPANAFQLRALLERVESFREEQVAFDDPFTLPHQGFGVLVKPSRVGVEEGPASPASRFRSPTYLRVVVRPSDTRKLRLHKNTEIQFRQLIDRFFPELAVRVTESPTGTLTWRDDRRGRWFECTLLDVPRDHEMTWLVASDGTLHFATQVEGDYGQGTPRSWSISDLVVNLIAAVRVVDAFWRQHKYYGEGYLSVQLNVGELAVARTTRGYGPLFYDVPEIPLAVASPGDGRYGIPSAVSHTELSFSARNELLGDSVVMIVNELLRSFRFAVDIDELGKAISVLLPKT